MAASRDARFACIPAILVLALLVAGMQPPVAEAQVSDRPDRDRKVLNPQNRSPDASTRLPAWAEPESPAFRGDDGRGQRDLGPMANDAPDLPGPPDQVPVDGGLSLLALAGAGYAARKLRQSSDDDESDRDDAV